ncbi:MAG TPA: transglutaminase family protein [Ilumatobacter sp.]|nr:transglutaminase family protein [Ilumatobacter sp.]
MGNGETDTSQATRPLTDLDIGCSFALRASVATHAVMLFEPHGTARALIADSRLETFGDAAQVPSEAYVDSFGNACRRITVAPGQTTVRYLARANVVDVPDEVVEQAELASPIDLPDEVLQFLVPSRYCESDQVAELAWSTFGSIDPGWKRVQSVCDWVHDRTVFRYGSSSPGYSALGVLESGVGVCRDFTHLAIALCRALNVPTRYVFGYLPDIGVPDPGTPMDFCAWMEVFLDGRWFTFDPRNNQRRIGRVVIGRGRDAADVAMVTSFGQIDMVAMTVWAELGSGDSWKDATAPGRHGPGLVN